MTLGLAAVALAAIAAALVLASLLRRAARLPMDRSGSRSLHEGAVPRGGGLSILAGAAAAALVAPSPVPGPPALWVGAALAVAAISLVDDVTPLNAFLRLSVHLVAAAAIGLAVWDAPTFAALAATALVVVWGANLFNFMDGSDGLAATMSVVGFGAYAIAAVLSGTSWGLLAGIAAASVPFLVVNLPPARLFMGDAGSVTLGFLAAAFGVAGVASGLWQWWFPALVFLPFIADATATLALRVARGERVWQPHRSHFYQRLNLTGAGHQGTLAIYAAAMLACAALALACFRFVPGAGAWALAVAAATHAIGFAAIDYHATKTSASRR